MAANKSSVLPGFRLTMGYTMLYLSLIVLIPIGALFLRVFQAGMATAAFTPDDFDDFPALWERLVQPHDAASAMVWAQFPPDTRAALAAVAEPQRPQALTGALNQLIAGEALFAPASASNVVLSAKADWYLRHAPRSEWCNRTLLEDAFYAHIKKKTNWVDLWLSIKSPRALAAYRLTFGASLLAALVNAVFGTLVAWVLVRYEFYGRRFLDALVDFPFALPTAVAGLTLASLFAANGWLGRFLARPATDGRMEAITQYLPWFGVVIALVFVGLPFVVRTLQPVLENFEREVEEASAMLGAGRLHTFRRVIFPSLLPSILTGFALAFARAIGEFGSVIFVSSNLPYRSEIAPYLIVVRLESYDYAGAMALAVVLLIFSFGLLVGINVIEQWAGRFVKE